MTPINIVIREPCPFYSPQDEDYFFKWLESIDGIIEINRVKNGLQVTIKEPVNKGMLADLMAVLSRYSIDMKPLKALCSPNNEKWFRDPVKYWYQEVFGEENEED